MSGSRAKFLRRQFRELFHRDAKRAFWQDVIRLPWYRRLGRWIIEPQKNRSTVRVSSEWRRFKTAWKRGGPDALEALRRA